MDDRDLVIQAGALAKRFGRVLALDGLSLEVRAGEVLGFLGPNGAGKTTTLRLLMGYLRPTAGSARVFGLDSWRDSAAIHARTGYLPGDVRLWPRLSARQIARHLARLRGLDHDQRIADLAKRLDVDLDRPVGELSKGNRQKAGVLLALLGDPELLLLDELPGPVRTGGTEMNAEITRQALRASMRTLVIWAACFAGLIALYAVIWPSVRGNTSWRNLFDTLPQTYRALFTASGTIDLSTAGGYLGVELMGFMGPR
jgi:ABC-type Na+ transport system ATPase subunit NatA